MSFDIYEVNKNLDINLSLSFETCFAEALFFAKGNEKFEGKTKISIPLIAFTEFYKYFISQKSSWRTFPVSLEMIVNAIHTSRKINRRKHTYKIPEYGKQSVRSVIIYDKQNEFGLLKLNPELNTIDIILQNPHNKNEISIFFSFDNFLALLVDIMNSEFNDTSFEDEILEYLGYYFSTRGFKIQKEEIKICNENEFKYLDCNNKLKLGYRYNCGDEIVELSFCGDLKEKYQIEIPLNSLVIIFNDLITHKGRECNVLSLEKICTILALENRKDANNLIKKMDLKELLDFIKSREIERSFTLTPSDKIDTVISKTKPSLNLIELIFKNKIKKENIELKLGYFEFFELLSSVLLTSFNDESFKKEIYRTIGSAFVRRGFVLNNPDYLNTKE